MAEEEEEDENNEAEFIPGGAILSARKYSRKKRRFSKPKIQTEHEATGSEDTADIDSPDMVDDDLELEK